ncbi:hypothetical protein GGI20_000213 [Coemansia sp. BCRC 34301]|nr:hypothetical protein GGI20_000213 [Coemansia sp. BCRC 34301]
MGISGLLPLLSEAQRPGHVKEFSGQTIGVDSYIWLYKGAFACASDLALNQPTTKYVSYFLTRARMLRHYGVEPLFVFDGGPLPSKLCTELERQRARAERRKQGIALWNQSKRKLAFEQFQRCVEVTPLMAKTVIDELKKEGFRFIVAPYEADAQLAYLESAGIVSACVSEDSDLIVFGCRNILFKLDQYGSAVVFDRARMLKAKSVNIGGWTNEQVRRMCILSGCDYVPSVPGVGLKKAHRYVARSCDLKMAVQLMRTDKLPVPNTYDEDVARAELTFRHQRVYDPALKALALVSPLDESSPPIDDMPFIGVHLEQSVAHGIAVAELDPVSYLPFDSVPVAVPAATPAEPAVPVASCSNTESAPVSRARSLQSFWGKPKPAVATREAVEKKAPECVAIAMDNEVSAKFRSNDRHSELVETAQKSRFFVKQSSVDSVESTQVADNTVQPPPLVPVPESQSETVVGASQDDDNDLSAPCLSPRVLRSRRIIIPLPLSRPRRPLLKSALLIGDDDDDETNAFSLFGQFMRKPGSKETLSDDIPEYAKHPAYSKKGKSKCRLLNSVASPAKSMSSDARTPITQIARRLSATGHMALQQVDDNSQWPADSPAGKRKSNACLLADAKKLRYPLVHVVDDIVDSSGSDTENRAITV